MQAFFLKIIQTFKEIHFSKENKICNLKNLMKRNISIKTNLLTLVQSWKILNLMTKLSLKILIKMLMRVNKQNKKKLLKKSISNLTYARMILIQI